MPINKDTNCKIKNLISDCKITISIQDEESSSSDESLSIESSPLLELEFLTKSSLIILIFLGLPLGLLTLFGSSSFLFYFLTSLSLSYNYIKLLNNLFVVELEITIEKILMIFFHNILDLIEMLFGELIRCFEYALDFIVDRVERIKIFFFKAFLLGFICQKRYFICYFLIVLC